MKAAKLIKKANFVYLVGNGGSASTANHFANDLVKKLGIKAISLCSNESIITAYANDLGYENVFLEQLKVFLTKEDLLISISTSGKSKNILKAIKYAKRIGASVLEFPIYRGKITKDEDSHLKEAHKIVEFLEGNM
jgi:D-sedoheptulose 7-phosphate isomerase